MMLPCIFFIIVAVAAGNDQNNVNNGKDVFTASNTKFAVSLSDVLKENTGNVLISPLSINYALTAISCGASGKTLGEIRSGLNQPGNETTITSAYKSFTVSLKDDANLSLATRLFVDTDLNPKTTFVSNLADNFDFGVDKVDFSSTDESRKKINDWVKKNTNDLILQIIDQGDINQNTVSILVNALHFKSQWKNAFAKNETNKAKFYGPDKEYKVDMMHNKGVSLLHKFDAEIKANVISLPYQDGDYSLIVVLPQDKKGIADVENKILARASKSNLSPFIDILKNGTLKNFNLGLPKFNLGQSHRLKDTLQKLGFKNMFTDTAEFNRLSDGPLKIDNVIQKAVISVDENGTEAAAASAAVTNETSSSDASEDFIVDHPFIFTIQHTSTQVPVLVGRFVQPSELPK